MALQTTREIITCPIHLDQMNDPIQMKCQHTFCRNCIRDWIRKKNECPICREKLNLNHTEIDSIRTSLIHKQLIDSLQAEIKQNSVADSTRVMKKVKIVNQIKISFVGNSNVGKSCIIKALSEGKFDEKNKMTVGIDTRVMDVEVNNTVTRVYLWDTAGQERFRTISRAHYRNNNGIIIVFDKTDMQSFQDVISWLDEIKVYCLNEDLIVALVGNKTDLRQQQVVSTEMAQTLADKNNLLYFETSAKTGENLQLLLKTIVGKINSAIEMSEIFSKRQNSSEKIVVRLDNKSKGGCCS